MLIKLRKLYLVSLIFAGLMALIGAGQGSMFMPSLSTTHGNHQSAEMTRQCQSACPLLLRQNNQAVQIRDEEKDPDPVPYNTALSPIYINFMYSLVLGVLGWSFLRRKPPDILANYGIFRI